MQVPETPKPSEEELQDRLKWGHGGVLPMGQKKKHIPSEPQIFGWFWYGMCSPVYEFRPEIRTKKQQVVKGGQGHVFAQPQDAKIIYYSPSCAPIEEKRSQVRTIHASLVWRRTRMIWNICICMEINEISGKDFSMEDFSTSLLKKMHDVETCRELLGEHISEVKSSPRSFLFLDPPIFRTDVWMSVFHETDFCDCFKQTLLLRDEDL